MMLRPSTVRRLVFSLALICGMCMGAFAQIRPGSSLPATQPTSAPQAGTTVAPLTATPAKPDANRAHRADVRYDSGLIAINASNSSLNQILREISRQTGMKITGGVRDERVFGHYGPAPVADILATLIDGTGTNMVLRQTAANSPEELILTPRSGGVSPPNPNAPGFDDGGDDDSDARQQAPPTTMTQPVGAHLRETVPALTPNPGSIPPSIPQPDNNPNGNPANTSPTASTLPVANSVSSDSIPTPSTAAPAPTGIVDAPNPPPAGTVNPLSPNGVKTPEDIYKQLQQLRQQQQQSTTPTPPATTGPPQ
jgi:hypothetical protein